MDASGSIIPGVIGQTDATTGKNKAKIVTLSNFVLNRLNSQTAQLKFVSF